jgi:hypothetical protein
MSVYLKRTIGWACLILLISFLYNCVERGPYYREPHNQPYMESALRHLQNALDVRKGKAAKLDKAKTDLELAKADKGGHRVAAVNRINKALEALTVNDFPRANAFIREAIEQVKLGIAVGAAK